MNHSFDIDIAKQYGVEEAIIIENIAFWIKKNISNNKHNYDGYYWTYNSCKSFSELFPYIKADKINRILNKLIEKKVLIVGNYNKYKYDQTRWYSIIDTSIMKKFKLEYEKIDNRILNNSEPIPDINTDINTYINTADESATNTTDVEYIEPKSEYKQKVECYNNFLLRNNYNQETINKCIFKIQKELKQLS